MWYIAHYENDLDDYCTKEIWVDEGQDPLEVARRECPEDSVIFDTVLRK